MGTYEDIGTSIGRLVEQKNLKYGNSFNDSGKIMRVLYPDGISTEQMDDALALIRIVDKMFRIATDKDAFGESPAGDIAGYAILMKERHDRLAKERAEETTEQAPAPEAPCTCGEECRCKKEATTVEEGVDDFYKQLRDLSEKRKKRGGQT